MKLKFNLQLASLATAVALAAVPSFAQPIDLSITGNTEVTSSDILFNTSYLGTGTYAPAAVPASSSTAANYGQFQVTLPVNSIFAASGVTAGELGAIQSLSAAAEPAGTTLAPPLTFMTFAGPGGTNLTMELTKLDQGSFVPGSPFSFTQVGPGAVASFGVEGFVMDAKTGMDQAFTGTFSATFANLSVAGLTNPANLPQKTPFSATFVLTLVPEPASLLLVGAGLLGAGIFTRRKSKV